MYLRTIWYIYIVCIYISIHHISCVWHVSGYIWPYPQSIYHHTSKTGQAGDGSFSSKMHETPTTVRMRRPLLHTATYYYDLLRSAAYYTALQRAASYYYVLPCLLLYLPLPTTSYSVLQCTTMCFATLQHLCRIRYVLLLCALCKVTFQCKTQKNWRWFWGRWRERERERGIRALQCQRQSNHADSA